MTGHAPTVRAVACLALALLAIAFIPEPEPPPARPAATGPLGGRSVAVDPGHGGPDPGAVGPHGVLEKHVVLAIGLRLKLLLERAGATVHITRTTDEDTSGLGPGASLRERWRTGLRRRAEWINAWAPDAVVSIHANAVPSSRWYGGQVFYHAEGHPASRLLAEQIQRELVHVTGRTRRAASTHIEHYVLENVRVPAATVEVGFLSNPEEERLLADAAYQDKVAWAILVGLARYFHAAAQPAPAVPAVPAPSGGGQ